MKPYFFMGYNPTESGHGIRDDTGLFHDRSRGGGAGADCPEVDAMGAYHFRLGRVTPYRKIGYTPLQAIHPGTTVL